MEHFMEPVNRGTMDNATGTGVTGVPGSGPFFVFQIRTVDGRVTDTRFQSHTCGVTVASGSVLTELVIGRSMDECRELSVEYLTSALGGVPSDKLHVPETAIKTLYQALTEAAIQ